MIQLTRMRLFMFKLWLLALGLGSLISSCGSNHGVQQHVSGSQPVIVHAVKITASQSLVVGGWAPVFFTTFDTKQLENIALNINQQRVKRAVISYPTKMEHLALKIHDYLKAKTNQDIPMASVELKDTDQIKYNLTQVIVTLYFY